MRAAAPPFARGARAQLERRIEAVQEALVSAKLAELEGNR